MSSDDWINSLLATDRPSLELQVLQSRGDNHRLTRQRYPEVYALFYDDAPMPGRQRTSKMTVEELATEFVSLEDENEGLDIFVRRRAQVLTNKSHVCFWVVVGGLIVLGVIMWLLLR